MRFFLQTLLFYTLLSARVVVAQSPELWQLHGNGVQKNRWNAAASAISSERGIALSAGLLSMQVAPNQLFDAHIIGSQTGSSPSETAQRAQRSYLQGPGISIHTKKFGVFSLDTFYQSVHHSTGNIDLIFNGVPGSRQLFPSGTYRGDAVQSVNVSYAYPIRYKRHELALGGTVRRYNWQYHQSVSLLGPSLETSTNRFGSPFRFRSLFSFKSQATGMDWGGIYVFKRRNALVAESTQQTKKRFAARPSSHVVSVGISFIDQGIHQLSQVSPIYFGLNLNRSESDWSGDISDDISNYNVLEDGQREVKLEGSFSPLRHVSAEVFLGNSGWSLGTVWTTNLQLTRTGDANSQVLVYPRFQAQNSQISFPLQLNTRNGKWGAGFHVQMGLLVAGVQSLSTLFVGNETGLPTQMYVGLSFAQK